MQGVYSTQSLAIVFTWTSTSKKPTMVTKNADNNLHNLRYKLLNTCWFEAEAKESIQY
jgi:hypothetical protein